MTGFEPGDDEQIIAMIRESTAQHDAHIARIAAFCTAVQEAPGPLGQLFREVAHQFVGFRAAVAAGATTGGEEARVYGVVEAAVDAWVWLGERS